MNLLLNFKANIHHSSKVGHTALMLAAFKNAVDVMKVLIDAGAEIETEDMNGMTALFYAAEGNAEDAANEAVGPTSMAR